MELGAKHSLQTAAQVRVILIYPGTLNGKAMQKFMMTTLLLK
jgi:hypothetical protein